MNKASRLTKKLQCQNNQYILVGYRIEVAPSHSTLRVKIHHLYKSKIRERKCSVNLWCDAAPLPWERDFFVTHSQWSECKHSDTVKSTDRVQKNYWGILSCVLSRTTQKPKISVIQLSVFSTGEKRYMTFVATSCHLCLHACDRSLFARGLSIDSRAYVISQHACWPIRAPRPTCANLDVWVAITPKRPRVNSSHTATRHAWTGTQLRYEGCISLIHFPASFIWLRASCHFDLGGSGHGWGCS